jgi:hypothetical protein
VQTCIYPELGIYGGIEADSDYPVMVRFDLWHLGTRWADRFRGDELVVVAELAIRRASTDDV